MGPEDALWLVGVCSVSSVQRGRDQARVDNRCDLSRQGMDGDACVGWDVDGTVWLGCAGVGFKDAATAAAEAAATGAAAAAAAASVPEIPAVRDQQTGLGCFRPGVEQRAGTAPYLPFRFLWAWDVYLLVVPGRGRAVAGGGTRMEGLD